MQAEAVVQVEAGAADAGFLLGAGEYAVLAVVVGQDFHHFFFAQTVDAVIVQQAAAAAVVVGIIGRKLSAFGTPVPGIVIGVGAGDRQFHAAALVARVLSVLMRHRLACRSIQRLFSGFQSQPSL